MPQPKSNLSTTSSTRILAALPSKIYLALHEIFGGMDNDARIQINELARALVLDHFVNELNANRFLTEEEIEKISPMMQIPKLDLAEADWDELERRFKARGQFIAGGHDPNSDAYIVNCLDDLEFPADLELPVNA